jgi:hypothetical protein
VPGVDYPEFAGTWSNYRFGSGTVVVSAIENHANGLFVLKPTLPSRGVESSDPARAPGAFGNGQSSGGGQARDTRRPNLNLRMRRVQDVDKLRLRVRPDEAVGLLAGARVKIGKAARIVRFRKTRRTVSTGQRATLRLKLSDKNERAVKRAIRRGERPRARVTVGALDVNRNAITKKRRVRLKR